MSQGNMASLLVRSVTLFPSIGSMYVQNPASLSNTINNDGYLKIGLRHLAAEPLFIISTILGTIETVVRAFLALIAHGIHCLIPAGDTRNEFKEYVVDLLDSSVFVNFGLTAFCLVNIATNLFKEIEMDTFDDFSKSLGAYFNVVVTM
jgi:hypothetical protein